MKFDDLDLKMRIYETAPDRYVVPNMYMVARLDGRNFTRLTKETYAFEAPFDEKYNPNWVNQFNNIKSQLEAVLSGLACSIEHVGSTSVPNLDSKPIIDIDIVYQAKPDFEKIKQGLEKIGYYHNGNQGLEGREVFKRSGQLSNEVLDHIKHHLYVCPTDSKALERHLLSRNHLRKNEGARIKYQQMKYALAEQSNQDRKKYQELKELYVNDFIDSMIAVEKTN